MAGAGPMPMMLGSTPATPHCTRRASGCRPFFFAKSSRREHERRRAVADARRVARRDDAVLLEDRGELGERLQRRLRARVLVHREACTVPFFVCSSIGAISSLKRPASFAAAQRCWLDERVLVALLRGVMPYFCARFSAVTAIGVLQ